MASKLNSAIDQIDAIMDRQDEDILSVRMVELLLIRNELVGFNNQLIDLLIEFQDDVLGAEEEIEAVPDTVVTEAVTVPDVVDNPASGL